jgi:hypothetical protein
VLVFLDGRHDGFKLIIKNLANGSTQTCWGYHLKFYGPSPRITVQQKRTRKNPKNITHMVHLMLATGRGGGVGEGRSKKHAQLVQQRLHLGIYERLLVVQK